MGIKSLSIVLGAVAVAAVAPDASAQANPVHTHIGHVATGFPAAPDGQGLLPAALAEARIAAQHADLASRDPANLAAMKTHAGHALHALSPSEGSRGPGLGFGVKRAAEGVAGHVGIAAGGQGASQNVKTHAGHITASANNVVQWTDETAALVGRIQAAATAAEAAPLVEELRTLTARIISGQDANADGRVSWEAGEGGLQAAEQHLGLLSRAEGL